MSAKGKHDTINIKTFEKIFKLYYTELCKYAVKYLKNEDSAEEIVQDVYYNIWEKRTKIDINISIKPYLYASVRNKCLQHLNHQKVINTYKKDIEKNIEFETENPQNTVLYKETLIILRDVLNSLPENCSEIFKLSRFDGLKYNEIANKLKISVKTVEANISKALKTFRIYFPEYK